MASRTLPLTSASTPFNSAVRSALPSSSCFIYAHQFRSSSCFMYAPQMGITVKKKKSYNSKNICCRTEEGQQSPDSSNHFGNVVLKLAWYASEALGIAASLFRETTNPPEHQSQSQSLQDEFPRDAVVDAIKNDYQTAYFVTGNLTMAIYKEDCEFADPAGSFKGLKRFKRNCSNFGSLLKTSNMKLMDWKDFQDRGVGYWRFTCILAFPWRPILSATGYTEYYYDIESGKICRHIEHWNVPKMVLLKQIFKPNPGLWHTQNGS